MRFSIIIATRNRLGHLDQCLTALDALHYPTNKFEVLVIDDGSDSPPDQIIARHTNLPVRYYRENGKGPARARNRGLNEALGEYVVFTDDDCWAQPDWLDMFDRAFKEQPDAGFGGRIVSAPGSGICGMTSQMLITFLYNYAAAHPGKPRFFCTNNLAFRRQALLDLGGFAEVFSMAAAEDRDLCDRWLAQGELYYLPGAVVQHRQDLNLLSFSSQHYRYGRGAFRFWERCRERGQPGLRVEPARFYRQMLAFPFSREPAPRAVVMFLLLLLSQVANAAGYFFESWKRTSN